MLHVAELEEKCLTTKDCGEYINYIQTDFQSRLQSNEAFYTERISEQINFAIIVSVVIFVIAIAGLVKPLKAIITKIFGILAVISPVIIFTLIGTFIGFWISFSNCYKSDCSVFHSSAILSIPALAFFVSIPLANKINKKRSILETKIKSIPTVVWIVICALLLLLVAFQTYRSITAEQRYRNTDKEKIIKQNNFIRDKLEL